MAPKISGADNWCDSRAAVNQKDGLRQIIAVSIVQVWNAAELAGVATMFALRPVAAILQSPQSRKQDSQKIQLKILVPVSFAGYLMPPPHLINNLKKIA